MGQVEISAARTNDLNRLLERGHHAQSQQIDLDNAQVGTIVLVPLHDYAPGHAGVFERNDGVEIAAANHHAAGVLPQVPRQVLDF